MSVNVRITQESDHRRRLDLAFVRGLAAEEGLYFGIMNDVFCLETFEGEDVHDVWLVLFSQRIYCRGLLLPLKIRGYCHPNTLPGNGSQAL